MQHIIRHLFRVDTLEEVPRERLEELVVTYPSFSMGRYLLSRKLHKEGAGHFSEETQKTNLYFSNPFWLQWLLQNEVEEQKPAYTRPAPPAYTPVEEPVVTEDTAGQSPAFIEQSIVSAEPVIDEEAAHMVAPPIASRPEELSPAPLSAAESLLQSLEEARELRQSLVKMNEVAPDEPVHNEESAGQTITDQPAGQPITDHPTGQPSIDQAATSEQTIYEQATSEQPAATFEQAIPVPEETPEELMDEELAPDYEPADFEKAREAMAGRMAAAASEWGRTEEERSESHEVHAEGASESSVAPPSAGQEAPVATPDTQAGSQTPSVSSAGSEPPTAIVAHAMALAEPIVLFEPYHTIDYFASVGIKFVQDENPQDKLGKQLKSFTDWLKVMRKLPQKNQEIVPDVAAEHQIQAIAAHSIKGKEILTETMAEVLVKQGMREKALEVYHKLSLLNPDKSAYFATKIEQLKID